MNTSNTVLNALSQSFAKIGEQKKKLQKDRVLDPNKFKNVKSKVGRNVQVVNNVNRTIN